MNIPREIIEKYNYLKQSTYEALGLAFSPAQSTYVPTITTNNNNMNTLQSDRSETNLLHSKHC